MAASYATLTAAAAIDAASDRNAALQAARLARKNGLYTNLNAIGVNGVYSWDTGSVPSSLVEMYAWSLFDLDLSVAYLAQGALNSTAISESGRGDDGNTDQLSVLADEVYDNQRAPAKFTVGRVLLTDAANAGPWTFNPATVSVTVGRGGKRYDGFDYASTGTLTLPRGGTVYLYVQSEAAGSVYSALSLGAINTISRGNMSGVTVTNDSTWLTFSGAQTGTDGESDATLRERDTTKWGTLGTGSPERAYRNRALAVDPTSITRVGVFTNYDIFDPGRVDVVLAGPSGAVAIGVVQAVQDDLAPNQIGGSFIPETARVVVTSALNRTIAVAGTIYVQKEINVTEFQTQVSADFATFAASHTIGGLPLGIVSAERISAVLQYRAGLNAGAIVLDADSITPNTDTTLAYNEVPVFDLTGLSFVSS